MKSGIGDLPFSRRKCLHDRKVARSAGSSGKLPDLQAAVAQIKGRSTYIGRAAGRPGPAGATGRPVRLAARPDARCGQNPMPIRAASRAAAVREETPILDSTAET